MMGIPRWLIPILLAAVVAQQIFAATLDAIYGSRCSAPAEVWWGTFRVCHSRYPGEQS